MEPRNTNLSKLIRLSDRFFVYPYEERTDRPNLYYILGDDYSVAVDAGNSWRHVHEFYDALKEMNFPLPSYTVISHWHWDHTFGLNAIHGVSLSSQKTHDKLSEVMKWSWTIEAMKQREIEGLDIPFCTEHILIEYPDLNEIRVVTTDEIIGQETEMDLGGIQIRIIPAPSTHTDDALYVYLPSEKALIVEDADCEDFYHGNIYDQETLHKMISFFESTDYMYHYLGHAKRETNEFALNRLKGELK
ncbi:MAG: MBL fold metallo-hydrolase [Erysipelotrichaceae bacterium]|nr:MBL fold metallo-hydrolase [Erysipelotrichaceae bacterium]